MMKKRMMALCLAVILLFSTGAETLYAMEGESAPQNVGAGQAVTPGDSGAAATAMKSIGRLGKTVTPGDGSVATPGDGSTVTPGDGSTVTPGDGEKTYTVTFDFGGGTVNWTPIVYKIKFAKGGGTGSMATKTFRYDEKKKLPKNTFTRKGYVFTGWKYKINGVQYTCLDQASILNLVSQDGKTITFTATWKRGTYTIRFHANGGKGSMNTAAATYGKTKTLPSNKFKRSG